MGSSVISSSRNKSCLIGEKILETRGAVHQTEKSKQNKTKNQSAQKAGPGWFMETQEGLTRALGSRSLWSL